MRSVAVMLAIVSSLLSLPVVAQPARTFVSAATGDDLNGCSLASPCRNLRRGVEAVAAGGEVVTLDSGGYGNLTISKSVTIAVPAGVYAGVTALSGGSGVAIDTAGVDVKLRGLTINALGGNWGVLVTVASVKLNIERSSIGGFAIAGVDFVSNGGRLVVAESVVRDSGRGVSVSSNDSSNIVSAALDRVQLSGNGWSASNAGVEAGSYSSVAAHGCVAHGNFRGFQVATFVPAPSSLVLEYCAATSNAVGVFAGADSGPTVYGTVYVSNSIIANNTLYGIEAQGGGSVLTRSNNTVIDNAAAETFTGTYVAK